MLEAKYMTLSLMCLRALLAVFFISCQILLGSIACKHVTVMYFTKKQNKHKLSPSVTLIASRCVSAEVLEIPRAAVLT